MIKKLLTILAIAATLSVTAKAVTLYPNGVLAGDNVSLTDLVSDGWTVIHNTGYGSGAISEADISAWAAAAGSGYVFVGGINANGDVRLGATGLASEVLTQTYSNSAATLYSSSNLYWYNVDNYSQNDPVGSFGFAPISTIQLSEADTYDLSDPYRLSWHLDYAGGGWRLGDQIWLNYDNSFSRIVLIGQAGPSVPDSGSTLILVGAAIASLASLRRRSAR